MAQEDVAAANGATVVEKSVNFTAYKPQLIVEAQKVGEAVAFYKDVFGATAAETEHSLYPKRKADQELPHVVSAEIKLAGATVVVSDVSVHSGSNLNSVKTGTVSALLETDDVEAAVAKAVAAGAVKVEEVAEGEAEAEGGVKGKVTDPFGFTWIFVSPVEKSDKEENKEVV
ncbi:hypothetical protein F2Q68_00036500 [Brassica cretica]|uniref:Glyoxalase-like domain-containing protein n=1 Tax=Brassica cretica TaxID=69181 RepID=A0A8S9H712_BRACR|nr:hypothetical protein F2Q68_00036500 [Brassica cretica]